MRREARTNLPLGAEKDDPEFERAAAQSRADVAALDAAIQRAEATPYCPPFGPEQNQGGRPKTGSYFRPD